MALERGVSGAADAHPLEPPARDVRVRATRQRVPTRRPHPHDVACRHALRRTPTAYATALYAALRADPLHRRRRYGGGLRVRPAAHVRAVAVCERRPGHDVLVPPELE